MSSANTSRNNVVDGLNGQRGQGNFARESAKKVYSREFMLGRSALPISSTEPEYMKDFEDLRVINPSAGVPSNTQETLPSRIDVSRRPRYNENARPHNNERSRANNRADDYQSNGIRPRANGNAQTGRNRVDNRNSRYDGFTGERRQYRDHHNTDFSADQRSSRVNRSDFYRRPQNSERYNNNSRSYDSNNAGFRNSRRFSDNGEGTRTNHLLPEHETINSSPKKRTVIHYSLAKNSIVELSTCENAWVPSCRDAQKSTKTNDEQIEEIQKKIRSILNKITPETMVVLTKSIIDMEITTYNCLRKIIELLFQKAIDEPNFTPQYAYICSQMKNIEVISEDGKTKTSFGQLIVLKCQETFELVNAQEKTALESLSEIESCEDQALKKELQCKYEENERIQRKRSVGNCRFMCEMFKVKLLNSNVLQVCIRHLLKFPKEEPLECLCNILKHIGKYLKPENTFEKLQEFSSANYKTRISSRIRFMIQDIIDLKNNDWVPRNVVIKPKKLNEIEEEFTVVPNNNRMSSECTRPIEKPLSNHLSSNAQKEHMSKQNTAHSNFEKRDVENSLLANNSHVELNTCQKAWVPRFRISQKSTATSEVKIENEVYERKTIKSSPETKNIESDSSTKNTIVELKTCKNPWVPRFRNSSKLTGTNKVEIKEFEKNVLEHQKSHTSIKIKTDNQQNKISEEKTIKSNLETKNIEPDLLTKNNGDELKTCRNPWVPRFRNSHKLNGSNKLEIREIKTKVQELPKPDTLIKITTDNKQDSCETFDSIIFSITQENIVSLTNKLISSISSIDFIEEIIDVLFKRVIAEPSSISLLVEICTLLKGIVLSTNKGSMHVSFKKQLVVHCRKLLQMEISMISKETYTMIGGLFNKKLLPLNIMVEFINDIPNQLTSASVENICHLLKIIGAEIERPYTLKPTVKLLEAFVNNATEGFVTPRHKNEVKNLLKLRDNKWIPVKLIDEPPAPVRKDRNINRSHLKKSSSIPEGRKRGKNQHTKNGHK